MYKFVKIAPKYGEDRNGSWYFVPSSVEQVKEHFEKIFGQEIRAGIQDKVLSRDKHPTTAWRSAVDRVMCFGFYGDIPWLMGATKLENEVLNNRIRDFMEGMEMFLADGVKQFAPSWEMYEIVDELTSDELVYPREEQFHFEEVRYMQWDIPGLQKGTHWYAKVGNKDVRDKDGNMKWNTKEEAEKAAEWFCKDLNWKIYFKGDSN